MSEEKPSLSYVEKLRIHTFTIEQAKRHIKNYILNFLRSKEQAKEKNINLKKISYRLIGPSGVGKTEICYQIANELTEETGNKFQTLKIHTPVFCRDDFLVPFPSKEKSFEMLLSDFFPRDPDSYGIYIIDEFSRGDSQLQQLLWQIQNEFRLHLVDLPENWFVICTDNPDDELYNMVESFEDAAGIRRVLHLSVSVNVIDFLKYAKENKIHPSVIEFIQTYPTDLYDVSSQKSGAVYANPASWHKFSDILWAIELSHNDSIMEHIEDLEIGGGGLLNNYMVQKFIDFLKDRRVVKPADIVYNYSNVRDTIREMSTNNIPKLASILESFSLYVISSMPKLNKKIINNIIEFLTDLPLDMVAIFFNSFERTDFMYLSNFNSLAMKDERYAKMMSEIEFALETNK